MKIKLISTSKELALVRRIRKKVLELEQGFPHEVNIDGNDPRAVHALIYDGHKPVATGITSLVTHFLNFFADGFLLLKTRAYRPLSETKFTLLF